MQVDSDDPLHTGMEVDPLVWLAAFVAGATSAMSAIAGGKVT
jgi:hypothetical protein